MEIQCRNIGKWYRKETLFKDFNHTFYNSSKYAILGPNASGKSTLLRIISGVLDPSTGEVGWFKGETAVSRDDYYQFSSFSAPAMELFEDFTVAEMLEFHFQLKSPKISLNEIYEHAHLSSLKNKKYAELSSGLRNKTKLTLAIFTEAEVLMLDEPCTNFDQKNIQWYQDSMERFCSDQLVIIASNQQEEYAFCKEHIQLTDYK